MQFNLILGMNVTLLGGLLRVSCTDSDDVCSYNDVAPMQNATVDYPTSPVIPTIIIDMASKVSICDDFTIDASSSYGDGGRDWADIFWTVTDSDSSGAANASSTNITDYLNSIGTISRTISVPSFLLVPTTYTVSLQLENFLGGVRESITSFLVTGSRYAPIVTITGQRNRTTTRSSTLSLKGSMS
jgi:hypothetical protein